VRTVVIQPCAGERLDFDVIELAPGEEIAFGRGGDGVPVRLVIDDPAVPRLAGRIRAVDDFWTISNLSRDKTYNVENPEGGGEFLKIPPGRLTAPVPFEFSRVILPAAHPPVSFLVFAPQHVYAAPAPAVPGGQETIAAFSLNETAKYFLTLVALCEPRLRDPSSPVIPTVPQIIDRLAGHPACAGLTRSAVNFHIDYLASKKLRVKGPREGEKADWQRAALVSVALRFDLVRAEHLGLLPAPPRRSGRTPAPEC
jgi:hypothetical protein